MKPFEPLKYIARLIAAINDGAKSAQLGALAFTAIGLFLLATAQLRRHDAASGISGFPRLAILSRRG